VGVLKETGRGKSRFTIRERWGAEAKELGATGNWVPKETLLFLPMPSFMASADED